MPAKQDTMPSLALTCGIGSLLFMMFGGSVLFGSLGIMFALLSRRGQMDRRAIIGLGLSVAGLVLYALMVAAAVYMLMATGTMARIMADLQSIDMNSVNAASDIMAVVQKNLMIMYDMMMSQVTGGSL